MSSIANQWMNGKDLAIAMFGGSEDSTRGEWIIYGIKKANAIYHRQKGEALIFTGRLSTPARVSKWMEEHPDFCASHVLKKKKEEQESPALPPRRQRRVA